MPRKSHNELAAGIFVTVVVVATLGVVLWLGAYDLLRPARQRAYFFVREGNSAGGLDKGSFVQIAGANVGQITEVELDSRSGRTYYVAEIERGDVKIHSDGKAKLVAGLIGAPNLSVIRGSESAPLADREHAIEIVGGLQEAMDDISDVAEKLAEIAAKVRHEVDPQLEGTIMGKLHGILDDVKSLSAALSGETDRNRQGTLLSKIHASADNVTRITANLRRETDLAAEGSVMGKVHAVVDDVKDITADAKPKLAMTMSDVSATVKKIRQYTETDLANLLARRLHWFIGTISTK